MGLENDAKALHDCYINMSKFYARKGKNNSVFMKQPDLTVLELTNKSAEMLKELDCTGATITSKPNLNKILNKMIAKIKEWHIQYSVILGAYPGCVSCELNNNLDRLVRCVCEYEAKMIETLKLREACGDFDIRKVFKDESSLILLGSFPAWRVIQRLIDSGTVKYFSTEKKSSPFVTAFIDESIHPVEWDKEGHKGKAGSYIICRGDLADESEITESNVMADGVDYAGEITHIHRITETAIGKVLLSLYYDFEYSGNVHIFTDNQHAAVYWKDVAMNSKLAFLFSSVKVNNIPREKNKKADKLCRSRMLIDIPISTYEEIVKKLGKKI